MRAIQAIAMPQRIQGACRYSNEQAPGDRHVLMMHGATGGVRLPEAWKKRRRCSARLMGSRIFAAVRDVMLLIPHMQSINMPSDEVVAIAREAPCWPDAKFRRWPAGRRAAC